MANRRYSKYFPELFLFFDLIFLNLGLAIANILRFGTIWFEGSMYPFLYGFLNVTWVLTFISVGLHKLERGRRIIDHITNVLLALTINLAILFAMWVATKSYFYSREHIFYTYVFFSLLAVTWRVVFIYSIRYYRSRGFNIRNVVMIGFDKVSNTLEDFFKERAGIGFNLLGYFDERKKGKNILGGVNDFYDYAKANQVDVIFCNLLALSEEQVQELLNFAQNNLIKVNLISKFSFLGDQKLRIQDYGGIPVVNVASIPLDSWYNKFAKRAFDIFFSLLVVVFLLSWLIPVLAIIIKLDSKGPIFFKQNRTGKDGNSFGCLKLRSMRVSNDAHVKQATKNDSRITKVGAILRKTSLDELPQFFNVLVGDMSVVGPRPHMVAHTEHYAENVDKFMARHFVKPGITGLAQAKGYRGETKELKYMEWRVKLDRFYVYNWSLILDIKILFLTIVSLIKYKAY